MTSAVEIPEIVVSEHAEEECTYGETCTNVAVYRAVFEGNCRHPHLACIPCRAGVEKMMREFVGFEGWMCKQCGAELGHIVRWESV